MTTVCGSNAVFNNYSLKAKLILYGLFIIDLSLQSILTNNWSVDNLKKSPQ